MTMTVEQFKNLFIENYHTAHEWIKNNSMQAARLFHQNRVELAELYNFNQFMELVKLDFFIAADLLDNATDKITSLLQSYQQVIDLFRIDVFIGEQWFERAPGSISCFFTTPDQVVEFANKYPLVGPALVRRAPDAQRIAALFNSHEMLKQLARANISLFNALTETLKIDSKDREQIYLSALGLKTEPTNPRATIVSRPLIETKAMQPRNTLFNEQNSLRQSRHTSPSPSIVIQPLGPVTAQAMETETALEDNDNPNNNNWFLLKLFGSVVLTLGGVVVLIAGLVALEPISITSGIVAAATGLYCLHRLFPTASKEASVEKTDFNFSDTLSPIGV